MLRNLTATLALLTALAAGFGLLARLISPHTFWPPAIVALMLPLLLFANGAFAVILLLSRRWRVAIPCLVVAVAAVPVYGRLFALPDGAPDEVSPRVVFLTANLRIFQTDDRKEVDTSAVRRSFQRFDADVVLLQEARTDHWQKKFIETIKDLGNYGERHQYSRTFVSTYANELTPIDAYFKEPNEYNGFLITDVETELGTVRVINVHLESNQISEITGGIGEGNSVTRRLRSVGAMFKGYGRAARRRARQAEAIGEAIAQSPHPVIVGGDFNDVPSSYTYSRIVSTDRLRDAWVQQGTGLGTTFTGPLPGLRIDYLMVDTSLTIVDVERLDPAWSDHRPLRVTLTR